MSERTSQDKHNEMIQSLIECLFAKNSKDITADIPGYKRPSSMTLPSHDRGYTPDATAHNGTQFLIFKVETADSINDKHTEETWRFFAEYAGQNNAIFHIVVPPLEILSAKKRLKELDLTAKVIPID